MPLTRSTLLAGVLATLALVSVDAEAQAQPEPTPAPTDVEPSAAPPAPETPSPAPPAAQPSPTVIQVPGPVVVHVGPTTSGPPPLARDATPSVPVAPTSAAAPPDPGEYEDPELDVARPRRGHFMMRIGAGPSLYSFHGDRVWMGGADMTLGADTKAGSFGANLSFGYGRTEPGLPAWRVDLGADLAWQIGVVRLGLGPRVGALGISRVTYDGSFGFLTAGIIGIASVDLVHTEGFNMSLAIRPSLEVATEPFLFGLGHNEGGGIMGGTALLDFRWRAPKGPPKPKKPRRVD
jgi:hypothetical protein